MFLWIGTGQGVWTRACRGMMLHLGQHSRLFFMIVEQSANVVLQDGLLLAVFILQPLLVGVVALLLLQNVSKVWSMSVTCQVASYVIVAL